MKVEFKDVVNYKFKEDKILDDIKKYVRKTYSSHYAKTNKYQATEILYGKYFKVCPKIWQERRQE